MAILPVVHAPALILRATARPVPAVTPEIRRLVQDMIHTMYAAGGIGLAANQVGQPWQLFVASPDQQRGRELVVLNPVIVARRGRLYVEEGCLSVPGIGCCVPRAAVVQLTGLGLDGRPVALEGRDLLARIVQHEVDHLHGRLFVHRLSWWRGHRLLGQYQRQQAEVRRVSL